MMRTPLIYVIALALCLLVDVTLLYYARTPNFLFQLCDWCSHIFYATPYAVYTNYTSGIVELEPHDKLDSYLCSSHICIHHTALLSNGA
jgi:hypothetical protein